MALAKTTLLGAITLSATQLKLTSATSIAVKMLLRVDDEDCLVTDVTNAPTVSVVRGYNGTSAVPHNTLAIVSYGIASDFSQQNGVAAQAVYSYSVNGAITVPQVDQRIIIDKGSACALTLDAPTYDTNPLVTITSATSFAHTITGVALLADGTSTTPKSTATFGTALGATLTLAGVNGLWNVVSVENVTLA